MDRDLTLQLVEQSLITILNYFDGLENDREKVDVATKIVLQYMREIRERGRKGEKEGDAVEKQYSEEQMNRIKKLLDDLDKSG